MKIDLKVMKFIVAAVVLLFSLAAFAQVNDQVTTAALANSTVKYNSSALHAGPFGTVQAKNIGQVNAPLITVPNGPLPGINSIVNWTADFRAQGINPFGNPQNLWLYAMIGNPPQTHGTTWINAPVIPINVELHDANGQPRIINGHPLVSIVTPFIQPFLNSPVFSNASYTSSNTPTQITDAISRAEFFNRETANWHTELAPSVKPGQTIIVNQSTDPNHPNYLFALNSDGSCCQFVLMDSGVFGNALFNAIVKAINEKQITPADMSSFIFPNTFLYNNGDPNQCCVLGFHTYVTDGGSPIETRWVFDYSSWITPGLFGPSFQDVTALSHEIAEAFNDPFVASDGIHNATPWWLAPNGQCQDNLETGDVIEGLPNATFPITMNGMTYHPQNEALLQWFEFRSPSDALNHAYSYPDETVLTSLSAPQNPGCQ